MEQSKQKSSYTVLLSSIKMAIATFCSRILGLVREQMMAAFFGASALSDAFLVAYRIPNLLRDLLAEGAFSSAFVPTFVESRKEQEQKARELLWELFFLLGGLTLALSILIIIFAPELILLFSPSYAADPEKFALTVKLTQIMAPFLFLVSITALFAGSLNSLGIFFMPAMAPTLFNAVMILTMWLGVKYFTDGKVEAIYSMAIGVTLGGVMQVLMLVPILYKKKYGFVKPSKMFSVKGKKVVKLLGPGLIGFAATQINLLITTILASGAAVGSVSWLNYSFRLFQLPVGILGVSIGNSNLVHFSNAWKAGEKEKAIDLLQSSYFLSLLFILPSMAFLLAIPEEIVGLIYERGKFDSFATEQTAVALIYYGLGLVPYGLYKIWVPTFYVLDRQNVPVYCSLISIAINIAFCLLLTPVYGFAVLAFGTTLSMGINAAIQSFILKRELKLQLNFFFNKRIFKILFASVISFLLVERTSALVNFRELSLLVKIFLMIGYAGILFISYVVLLYSLGEKEAVDKIRSKISAKLNKKIN